MISLFLPQFQLFQAIVSYLNTLNTGLLLVKISVQQVVEAKLQ